MSVAKTGRVPLIVLFLFLVTGCSAFSGSAPPPPENDWPLHNGHSLGQTFVSSRSGLNSLTVWLAAPGGADGTVTLELLSEPDSGQVLATSRLGVSRTLAATDGTMAASLFSFPPVADSRGRYLYAQLSFQGQGQLAVGVSSANSYVDGSLYSNGDPRPAQMILQPGYAPLSALADWVPWSARALGLALAVFWLFVVPGWAVLVLFRRTGVDWGLGHWGEWLAVSGGLSLALYPLLVLWTHLVGFDVGMAYAWVPGLTGCAVLFAEYRPWRTSLPVLRRRMEDWWARSDRWPDLALAVVLGVIALSRLIPLRELHLPLWDDSVQHATMVQLMLEQGGLFSSWMPYAPYGTLSNQFGFHAQAAVWGWLTGANGLQSTLVFGQILNVLAVVTLFPLAYRVRGVWTGCAALVFAGLVTSFPAFYVNWGRYPQLAGQVLLPVVAWAALVTVEQRGSRRQDAIRTAVTAILFAACLLAYYRMAFHFAAFILAALSTRWLGRRLLSWRPWLILLAVAALAAVLMLPWLDNVSGSYDLAATPAGAGTRTEQTETLPAAVLHQVLLMLTQSGSVTLVVVTLLGVALAAWQGWRLALPVAWLWFLLLLPALRPLDLPGTWIIQDFSIRTSLYLAEALIVGAFAGAVIDAVATGAVASRRWLYPVACGLLAATSLWRLPATVQVVDRVASDLVGYPDLRAAGWIRDNLPEDAVFLINGIVYHGTSVVGGDAGWWLPLLTGRGVTIPPQYALVGEKTTIPGYTKAVNGLVPVLEHEGLDTPEGELAVCQFPIPVTHVYLGQRQGVVDTWLERADQVGRPMLDADELLDNPRLDLVYRQDDVWIFEFDRSVCSQP